MLVSRTLTQYNGGNFLFVDVYEEISNKKERKIIVSENTVGNFKQSAFVYEIEEYEKIFIGVDNAHTFGDCWKFKRDGNSVLIHVKNGKYIYINENIKCFDIGNDEILEFYSPTFNSYVPYPYAIGRNRTYLLLENCPFIENEKLKRDHDPYDHYYNNDKKYGNVAKVCDGILGMANIAIWNRQKQKYEIL